MVKYKLSNNVTIVDPAGYTHVNTPAEHRSGHFIMCDGLRDKAFVINETIKYFMDKFSYPKTIIEVLKEITSDVGSDIKEIEKGCFEFFKFLYQRRILVPENQVEVIASKEVFYNVGDYIDNLCIVEILGNKRFIDLYIAINEVNNRTCVIKLLNRKKTFGEGHYQHQLLDLEKEYSMLKNVMNISFVSQAYSFNRDQNQCAYIELEYIKGKSLWDFLKETGNLDEPDCMQIIKDILQAFSLLHENKLVHGDIHPYNILVLEDKSIKIIDLGLSLQINTEKNEVVKYEGAGYYMPPERIEGTSISICIQEPDFYSDVYQIGLMIYLIMYGTLPFTGFIWGDVAKSIKEANIPFPVLSFLNHRVSDRLIQVAKKCLNKNPIQRYPDAGEILKDFENASFKYESNS